MQAAKIVKSTFPDVVFQLAGSLDENPESISQEELHHGLIEVTLNI